MIFERYPAPVADELWSKRARADRMRQISDAYAIDAAYSLDKVIAPPEFKGAPPIDVTIWEGYEKLSGHEIVGFLAAYVERLPIKLHHCVHYGLTSSDLVEYDLHKAISDHADALYRQVKRLSGLLEGHEIEHAVKGTQRAGRTHGQTAEWTTLSYQFSVYRTSLDRIRDSIGEAADDVLAIKTPGPVGNSDLRGVPSTLHVGGNYPLSFQIIPRDILTGWASDYLRLAQFLESLAMFIRLGARSEIGEFQEGAAKDRQGSSAMPGKHNPIDSEKVSGLARIARGYHLALSEVPGSMWEERDLSNSSTERIAVPGLAATVEHMLDTMIRVIENLVINETRMLENTYDPATTANHRQNVNQRTLRVGPIEASRITKEEDVH